MFTFWDRDLLFPHPCDVAIIGGGFTGLSAAITIKRYRPTWHVVVIESEATGTLASARNAGFLCLGSPTELLRDIQNHGLPVVEEVLRCKIQGASLLLHYLKKTKLTYKKSVGYEFFSSDFPEPVGLDDHLETLNGLMRAAGAPAHYFTYLNQAPRAWCPAAHQPSWVKMDWEGQIHPAAAVARLRLQFLNLGGVISTHHRIESIDILPGYVLLQSALGTVQARQLLLANNAFVSQLIKSVKVDAHRAQVMITEPLNQLPFRGNVHFREGYLYARDVGQRLLIGGGRFLDFKGEQTDRLGTTDGIQSYLREQLSKLTAIHIDDLHVADQWSGIMGFTPAQLHPILEVKYHGKIVVAAGMNGMGTALGPYTGKKAAEMLVQEREGRAIHLPQPGFFPTSPKPRDTARKKKPKRSQ